MLHYHAKELVDLRFTPDFRGNTRLFIERFYVDTHRFLHLDCPSTAATRLFRSRGRRRSRPAPARAARLGTPWSLVSHILDNGKCWPPEPHRLRRQSTPGTDAQ